MKKLLSALLAFTLLFSATSALAASKKETKVKPNTYTIPQEGTVLQNEADRNISMNSDFSRNPVIAGESPTTGEPWTGTYLPMLMQVDNTDGGVGARAPWGGQYADIIYEGVLYRDGATRISFLFSNEIPESAGPVRSARIGHVLLREEWYSGFIFAGGPRRTDNDITEVFAQTGADEKGVLFDLLSGSFVEYKNRVDSVKAPSNLNCNPAGLRSTIPAEYESIPHPFLFTDESPYSGPFAYTINLDWGKKDYISHFYYDEANNNYYRYVGPSGKEQAYKSFATAEDRSEENMTLLTFSNLIIQRVNYTYTNNSKIMPVMQNVGQGNADIFIGGRYIAGYWCRKSIEEPTIYFDSEGNELQFTRGKSFIVHFPNENLCTFTGVE